MSLSNPLALPRAVYYVRLRDRCVAKLVQLVETYDTTGDVELFEDHMADAYALVEELRQVPGAGYPQLDTAA